MAKQRTSPGDVTGRKREQLQKEHAEELERRGSEISLLQAGENERAQNGVFDPSTGQEVDGPPQQARTDLTSEEQADAFRTTVSSGLVPGTRQVGDPGTTLSDEGILYADGQEDGVQTNETGVIGVGMETPFQVLGGVPNDELVRNIVDDNSVTARRALGQTEVEDLGVRQAEDATVVIRLNTTLDQVTIGVGTEYNFEEGKQYRVPKAVADHLEEKGYVWH